MEELLKPLGAMVLIIWAATEGLGRAFDTNKELLAAILGPVVGVAAWRLGFLSFTVGPLWEGLFYAALLGLLATFAADSLHRNGAKRAQKQVKKLLP